MREQPIGDHDPFHATIERSQDRNQPGPGTPLAIVLGLSRLRCEPPPPPSVAPAADPDVPAPHTTADGSTWSSCCDAGPADSTARTVDPLGGKGAGAIHGY